MIVNLKVNNYALIDQLNLSWNNNLTIITGETGAGKSILLGALGLILGQRADSGTLMDKTKKCVIEGEFRIQGNLTKQLKPWFTEEDLDFNEFTVLRREITVEGKSRAFINDTPVTLNQLKELGQHLVDIHSQHETLEINTGKFQLRVLDLQAETTELLEEYHIHYTQLTKNQRELKELMEKESQFKAEQDYLQFQFNELHAAQLENINQEELEQELQALSHAEEIKLALFQAINVLDGSEINVRSGLKDSGNVLNAIVKYYPQADAWLNVLKSAQVELQELSRDMQNEADRVATNPEKQMEIQAKLDGLFHLQNKHRVNSTTDLIEIRNTIESKLNLITNLDDSVLRLTNEVNALTEKLEKLAQEISVKRQKAIVPFAEKVNQLLEKVALVNAKFQIDLQQVDGGKPGPNGIDQVKYLFSANLGQEPKDLNKVASGGELSRLMLCIKALMASKTELPTMIFDEIDTGISGEVSAKVAEVLQEIALKHQVIAITHLPQMAAKGRHHFWVYKEVVQDKTYSRMKLLNEGERVEAIAKMLSGSQATEAAMANARELMN